MTILRKYGIGEHFKHETTAISMSLIHIEIMWFTVTTLLW